MSGGGAFAESDSNARDKTPKEFKAQRGFVTDTLVDRINTGGPGIDGPFAAPVTDAEQRGLNTLQNETFGAGGLGALQDDFLRNAIGGGQQNPFLQETIDAATRPIVENAQLRELQDRALFTGAGQKIQASSAFTEDRTRSLRDTERAIGDISSQISFQDFERRTREAIESVTLANNRLAEQRETITALALPRLVEQFGLDGANEEMRRMFTVMENALTELGNLTAPTLGTDSDSVQASASGSYGGGTGGN
jgi:hypothetical protein